MAERFQYRNYRAELHRLRGVFLAAIGADEAQIEASLREAIRIAQEQKSVSLEKRAEATYAGYRRQKRAGQEDVDSDYIFGDCSQCAVYPFSWGKSTVMKQTLEMQSEDTSAARDPLKEAC